MVSFAFDSKYFKVSNLGILLAPTPQAGENGCETKLFDLAKSVHWIVDESQYTNDGGSGLKRRRIVPGGDDSDDEGATTVPPTHDLYRLRQQKRLK